MKQRFTPRAFLKSVDTISLLCGIQMHCPLCHWGSRWAEETDGLVSLPNIPADYQWLYTSLPSNRVSYFENQAGYCLALYTCTLWSCSCATCHSIQTELLQISGNLLNYLPISQLPACPNSGVTRRAMKNLLRSMVCDSMYPEPAIFYFLFFLLWQWLNVVFTHLQKKHQSQLEHH